MTEKIRKAEEKDLCRIAEIEIFNYRLNFYPIFRNDDFYFGELRVDSKLREYAENPGMLKSLYVYDDGAVKGFVSFDGREIRKLFVEPVLQGSGIGSRLLEYALKDGGERFLWALEKNERALAFYARHGFVPTGERIPEEGTDEYLIRLRR